MMRPAVTSTLLTGVSQVEGLRAEWDALLARSRCNRAFSSSAWFLTACRILPAQSPHVLIARRGTELSGILPLVHVHGEGDELRFPTFLNDYNDVIVAEGDLDVAVGLLELALSQPRHRLVLRRLRDDSACVHALRQLAPSRDPVSEFQERQTSPYILLPPLGPDAYFRAKSKNFRHEYSRALRRAEAGGAIVEELTPSSLPPSQLPEVFLTLHLSRFEEQSGFRGAEAQQFTRSLLPTLFQEQRMRVFGLKAGGRLLGIDLCMLGPDGLCTWNGGFLPEAAVWSPGKLFFHRWLHESYTLGSQELDLMRGSQEWKLRCATHRREVGHLEFSSASP
jgi:CelD/BcsL family acetyltransferase involved in cellulose biosynthesis